MMQEFQNFLGQKLRVLLMKIYCYEGELDMSHPQAVNLIFDTPIMIECSSDGETLKFTQKVCQDVDLGEYGSEIVMDCSKDNQWRSYIDASLNSISLIESSMYNVKSNIGIVFQFDNHSSIYLLNIGDELYIFNNNLPKNLIEQYVLSMISIPNITHVQPSA